MHMSYKNLLLDVLEHHKEMLPAKLTVLNEALRLSEELIEQAGLNLQEFQFAEGMFMFIGEPIENSIEDGMLFALLGKEDGSYYTVIRVKQAEGDAQAEGHVGISASLIRVNPMTGAEELWHDGQWVVKFAFEDDEIGPSLCEECQKKKTCEQYQNMCEMENVNNLATGMNQRLNEMDKRIKRMVSTDAVMAQLLSVYMTTYPKGPSFRSWMDFLNKNRLTKELLDQTQDVLQPVIRNRELLLIHEDEAHLGFAIRQKENKLQLCQYINEDIIEASMYTGDEDEDEESMPMFIKDRLIVVGEAEEIEPFLAFTSDYLDRYNRGQFLFTIPLSMKKAMNISGPFAYALDGIENQIKVTCRGLPARIFGNGMEWLKEVKMCLGED